MQLELSRSLSNDGNCTWLARVDASSAASRCFEIFRRFLGLGAWVSGLPGGAKTYDAYKAINRLFL